MNAIANFLVNLLKPPDYIEIGEKDMFPHFKYLIEDFPETPAPDKTVKELSSTGRVALSTGVYDFYLQSFCLNVGKYSPFSGSGYILAPIKGKYSSVIKNALGNSIKYPDIPQPEIQSFFWTILAGVRYGDLSTETKALANKLLSKEELKLIGKTPLDIIPAPIRDFLLAELMQRLPSEISEVLDTIEQIKAKIADAQTTYQELESVAMKLGKSPTPKSSLTIQEGEWSRVGPGMYARAFPEGYTSTRVQVYVPQKQENYVNYDDHERITEMGIKNVMSIKFEFNPANDLVIKMKSGKELPIWRFSKIKFWAKLEGAFEVKTDTWVAQNTTELIKLVASDTDDPEVQSKIETMQEFHDWLNTTENASDNEKAAREILDPNHYGEAAASVGNKYKEWKWFIRHLVDLRGSFLWLADFLDRIGEHIFGPDDWTVMPADKSQQRLGMRGSSSR